MELSLKPLACAALLLALPLHAAELDRTVALVETQAILQSELDQAVAQAQRQLQARQQALPADTVLRRSVLDQMILQRIQLDLLKRSRAQVDEQAIDAALEEFAKQQGAPSLEAFVQAVQARDPQAMAPLRQQMRDRLLLNELRQQTLASRVRITDRDVDNFLASPEGQSLQARDYHTVHVLVAPTATNPTAADRKAALEVAVQLEQGLKQGEPIEQLIARHSSAKVRIGGGDMGWHSSREMDSALNERLKSLQARQTSGVIESPQGYQVIQLLGQREGSKTLEHQWQVRHILISPSESLSTSGAQTRINQISTQLQAGKSFADLASTYSTDPGSARAGGELGWVSAGQMVPEFEQMMKTTPVGQISAPFQSQFGWHVLQVQADRDQDVSQQKLREAARNVLGQRRMEQELDDWLRELRAGAYIEIRDPALQSDRS